MEKILIIVNSFIFVFSIFGIFLVFFVNPLIIWIIYRIRGEKAARHSNIYPSVNIIIIARNADDVIEGKIKNLISFSYPADKYKIIIFSDGSTDETVKKARAFSDNRVRVYASSLHEGKNIAINNAVKRCSGEVLVFTDVDTIVEPDGITKLVKYFYDPEVGGVCGRKVIVKGYEKLEEAQSEHIKFDNTIKKLESLIGSISSNDGTLYAIRRELFTDIPPVVTDDLYVCLSIVKQGYRFLFEPDAKAFISAPSRGIKHEIQRRRRIVSTSLKGIFLLKELINPFKYGFFSIRLMINKILRRFLPIFLLLFFYSSLMLSSYNPIIKIFFVLQIIFYILALSYWALFQHIPNIKIVTKLASLSFYFCIGNFGTLLGLFDFLTGRQITKWEPLKTNV